MRHINSERPFPLVEEYVVTLPLSVQEGLFDSFARDNGVTINEIDERFVRSSEGHRMPSDGFDLSITIDLAFREEDIEPIEIEFTFYGHDLPHTMTLGRKEVIKILKQMLIE